MATTPSPARARWYTAFVAVLTVALLWLFFRNLDFEGLSHAFATARLELVALAIPVTFQTYVIRAWRWQALLAPLGQVRFRTAFRTTVIGFAVTFALPARVGEVLRPYLLARQESLNASSAFATIIVERALDLATVLLLFGVTLPFLSVDVGPETRLAGVIGALASVALLAVLFVSAGHPERLGALVDRVCRILPSRVAAIIGRLARTFAEGLAVMRRPAALATALLWSVALWVSIVLGIWLVSRAFDLTMPFLGAFLVVIYLVVGVAAPTPGGAGAFHYMYWLVATRSFGAASDVAGAAALMLHAVSVVPVVLVGLVFMWQDGISLTGIGSSGDRVIGSSGIGSSGDRVIGSSDIGSSDAHRVIEAAAGDRGDA